MRIDGVCRKMGRRQRNIFMIAQPLQRIKDPISEITNAVKSDLATVADVADLILHCLSLELLRLSLLVLLLSSLVSTTMFPPSLLFINSAANSPMERKPENAAVRSAWNNDKD